MVSLLIIVVYSPSLRNCGKDLKKRHTYLLYEMAESVCLPWFGWEQSLAPITC